MMNINIDDDSLSGAVLDVVDSLVVHGLKQARESMITEYHAAKIGFSSNVFVVGDVEEDQREIRRRIEAFDLALDYFSVDHEYYDFSEETE